MDSRIRLVGLILCLGAALLVARLIFWQIVRGGELARYARSQYLSTERITAQRGSILASDGTPLTMSQISWQIFAEPQKLTKDKAEVARLLAQILTNDNLKVQDASDEAQLVYSKNEELRIKRVLSREGARWVLLAEKVTDSTKRGIEALQIGGVGWSRGDARLYPESTMSAHLLGFVGKDERGERGYFGLEGFYDLSLAGKSGLRRAELDVRGNPIPFGLFSEITPSHGLDLLTTIDRSVQFTIERELVRGIEKYGAKSGSIVVMRPGGDILASAAFPSYDPARYQEFDESTFKNPVVADSFEPGSVFKILVMSAALDTKVVMPETKCDACSGPVRIGQYTIHTWDDKYYPESSTGEIIKHSDNVGMVFVANRLGKERMWDYLNRFGIGRVSGIDLQEESSPPLRKQGSWGDIDLATAAFGQGIAVTPMQLVRAAAAIANRGILPVPRVVEKIQSGSWKQNMPAKDEGRIISEDAAIKITELMVEAVKAGEAKWAAPRGFRIAGKTGTAQIPIAGHYDTEKTIASFIGFAPADNPKFVMLVTLREPTSSPFGSETAAPLWFSIARDLFPYFGIGPSQ